MSDGKIFGFAINQLKFVNKGSLKFAGVHKCIVKDKVTHGRGSAGSSRSQYHLVLETESKMYSGVVYVEPDIYTKARVGKELGEYGVVVGRNGSVRFSKELDEDSAISDVSGYAKLIIVQTVGVLLFLIIPSLYYIKTILH